MDPAEYGRLAAAEDRMWWFAGLHANLIAAWREAGSGADRPRLLDAGCGTGGFLRRLRRAAPQAFCCGIDVDEGACRLARPKGGAVAAARIERLPFPDRSFDAVFSADVLCHRGVDEREALASLRRVLKPGGLLVLNLPAYRWLYSAHDQAVANARRYGRAEVAALLAEAGFEAPRPRYWNSLLFPLMVARRKLAGAGHPASDVRLMPAPLERFFAFCLAFERGLAARGLRFPFGGSILATAVNP